MYIVFIVMREERKEDDSDDSSHDHDRTNVVPSSTIDDMNDIERSQESDG